MATTTNFGWETPDDTDLVKDGAAAIRTALGGVDTSFVDLKGGTTGQVLAKASNTDLDFSWVAQDDSNAIQNALLTTTGDTIYASGASTPARLGIGSAGQVLTVQGGLPTWAAPAAGGAFTSIASGSVPSGANTFTLSSISQSYKHLRLVLFKTNTGTSMDYLNMRWNGVTTSTYSFSANWANGEQAQNSSSSMRVNYFVQNSSPTGQTIIDIYNYSDSTIFKYYTSQGVDRGNTANATEFGFYTGGTQATTAISSITIFGNAGSNFGASGTYILFGVN